MDGHALLPNAADRWAIGGTTAGLIRIDDITFHPLAPTIAPDRLPPLAASIAELGVLDPIVVECATGRLRVRAGHHRVVAARRAGLERVPALIRAEPLTDRDWLIQRAHWLRHSGRFTADNRRELVTALRDAGADWASIGAACGVSQSTVRLWAVGTDPEQTQEEGPSARRQRGAYFAQARRILLGQLDGKARALAVDLALADVDEVAVERALHGERLRRTLGERIEVARRWCAAGGSLVELYWRHRWNLARDLREVRAYRPEIADAVVSSPDPARLAQSGLGIPAKLAA